MKCQHCSKPATKYLDLDEDVGIINGDDLIPAKDQTPLCERCFEQAESFVPPSWMVSLIPFEPF
jgi:thymidine kinase